MFWWLVAAGVSASLALIVAILLDQFEHDSHVVERLLGLFPSANTLHVVLAKAEEVFDDGVAPRVLNITLPGYRCRIIYVKHQGEFSGARHLYVCNPPHVADGALGLAYELARTGADVFVVEPMGFGFQRTLKHPELKFKYEVGDYAHWLETLAGALAKMFAADGEPEPDATEGGTTAAAAEGDGRGANEGARGGGAGAARESGSGDDKDQTSTASKLMLIVPGLFEEAALMCATRREDVVSGVVVVQPTSATDMRQRIVRLLFFGKLLALPWLGQLLMLAHRSIISNKYLRHGFPDTPEYNGAFCDAIVSTYASPSSSSSSSQSTPPPSISTAATTTTTTTTTKPPADRTTASGQRSGVRRRGRVSSQSDGPRSAAGGNGAHTRGAAASYRRFYSAVVGEALSKGARFPLISAARNQLLMPRPDAPSLASVQRDLRARVRVPVLVIGRSSSSTGTGGPTDADQVPAVFEDATLCEYAKVHSAGYFPELQQTSTVTAYIASWAAARGLAA